MDIQGLKNVIKERGSKILVNIKVWFANTKVKILAWPRKKQLIVLSVAAILVVGAVVLAVVRPFSKGGELSPKDAKTQEEYNILFKGKPNLTVKMGETVNLGNLKIDFYNIKESSYLSFDKDQYQNRITVRYLAAQVSVQNLSGEKTENILIGLSDDQGKKYRLDYSVPFYVADTRDFGRNMFMYPRTITDGYIFFSNVDENAKNLELVVALTPSKEKAAFKFERK